MPIRAMPQYARVMLLLLPALAGASLLAMARSSTAEHSPSPPDAVAAIVALDPMRMARMAHTATSLSDGTVLVVGGFTNPAHADQGAVRFDPGTGHFTPSGPLGVLRHSHTATALADGRVLVVGGYADGNQTTASAELFDPHTQRFVATGSLGVARAGHVAVLLANGKVLIAGGLGANWTFLSSAELYDPATGRFTPTGAMTVARESHVGIGLSDGGALVAGGHRDRREAITLYASAERYDVATGTFRAVGSMTTRRHKHDGVRLADGRVLITGGSDERDSRGMFRSTEIFDPRTNQFTRGPEMRQLRYKHVGSSLLLPSGDVLVAGGAPEAERFDATQRAFVAVPGTRALTGHFSAVAPLPGGGALITGGYGLDRGPQANAWRYLHRRDD